MRGNSTLILITFRSLTPMRRWRERELYNWLRKHFKRFYKIYLSLCVYLLFVGKVSFKYTDIGFAIQILYKLLKIEMFLLSFSRPIV